MQAEPGPAPRRMSTKLAVGCSALGVLFVALVASVPGSPFQPVQPPGVVPRGPFAWLARSVGLERVHGDELAAIGVVAVFAAAVTFLLVLREAWNGRLSLGLVLGLAVAYHLVVLTLPLLFSRDVYSYAYYGRISSLYHANPYVQTPADFPRDLLAHFVGPKWRGTPAVYGPAFTLYSSLLTRNLRSVDVLVDAFRVTAAVASLLTVGLVAQLARTLRPERASFAVAALGLNPVWLFQSVGSGHNDLLVALSVVGAFALLLRRRELLATAALTLGTLVKATAGVPLLLLVVWAVARRPPGTRARRLAAHLAVAGGLVALFAAPFFQLTDPSLGMVELAQHEGWLAPSRLLRRFLDWASADTLGVLARVAFPLALLAVAAILARSLWRRAPDVEPPALAAHWGWGLVFLMLLGPVLLPWYVAWALPLVWLLPREPRIALLATSVALTVSQFTTEPAHFPRAYDANLLWGHYGVTPVVFGLLVWLILVLRRRVRDGTAPEDERQRVPAAGDEN